MSRRTRPAFAPHARFAFVHGGACSLAVALLWLGAAACGDDSPAATCRVDQECPAGHTCDQASGECVERPDPGGPWADAACYPGSLSEASTGERLAQPRSCRYHNRFAGADCKLYIGAQWQQAQREADCGSGFVEQNAHLEEGCCPSEIEGVAAIGGCRVKAGTADEILVISYGADPAATKTACENFQSGLWEPNGDLPELTEPTHHASEAAFAALASSDEVVRITHAECVDFVCLQQMVENAETFDFIPQAGAVAGVALYPGGGVDPRAYAVMARRLAERGLYVAIVPMENFLALAGVSRADDVQAAHPEIEHWFVVGHSLGGTMVIANALTDGGNDKAGFVIWASVSGKEYDYSAGTKPVLSVWATLDAGNDAAQVEANKRYLPADTHYVAIENGIHAYFGDYTNFDSHDDAIPREQQQAEVIDATVAFIAAIAQP
jgi:hypothetical protein